MQKVGDLHARDRRRILKGEEEPGARALVGGQGEQVLAVERDVAGDLVMGMAGQREGERRFAAPVGTHQAPHPAGLDGQVDSLEDLVARDAAMQVGDTKTVARACDSS